MLSLAAGTGTGAPPTPDPVFAPPVEQLPPALQIARQELAAIVARRDMDALLARIRPDSKFSFGGDHGPEDFRRMWDEDGRERRQLWQQLDAILALPGEARESEEGFEYCTPYVFCLATPGEIDPFDARVITGTDVAIRERPGLNGKVVARVSHVVLTEVRDEHTDSDPEGWTRVRLASGVEGFVSTAYARSQIDYRLALSLNAESGEWWLRYFLAGD
ncbi:SH3 domain-containing protein [Marilutibacter chinensis]|uniref:SH3 domain-containing protein n=1 Tax=Marilutibacter chinensis TaxID=2912247 RepID=A0ABS9HYJ5_9GAMM|nr:SH3 domain-containing protein [Lysobacter chinensis]MCF7223823.1 SH3 domain-containing protein [Lysobacter chinensis]